MFLLYATYLSFYYPYCSLHTQITELPESKHYVINEHDTFECSYCNTRFALSSIAHHMRFNCPRHTPELVLHEERQKNNKRAKKYQKEKRLSHGNVVYSKLTFNATKVHIKRDQWLGRVFNLLYESHPFYLSSNTSTDIVSFGPSRLTKEQANDLTVAEVLRDYSKLLCFINNCYVFFVI